MNNLDSPIISIRNISFRYRSKDPDILNIAKLDIFPGEKLFLHGPSGSGKTTLLGLLSGIIAPQEGSLTILGKDFAKLPSHQRDRFRGANIGYIFQMFNLLPYLSAIDNITLSCELSAERKQRIGQDSIKSSAENLARELGIFDLLNRRVTELSVGQQQRVAAARAILGKPKFIIADEPTSSLDSDHRESFLRSLFSVCEKNNATLILVSHDRQIMHLFDRSVSITEINKK
jgi:putative ABC transport system ATP-binding protein